jgi:hypothetical protein
MAESADLIPPDDPRFEGAEYISSAAAEEDKLRADWLLGVTWEWARWNERAAIRVGNVTMPKSDAEATVSGELAVWDHDHCEICHAGFSSRYPGDLREGWTMPGPAGLPRAERTVDYHWLCAQCFDRHQARMHWTVRR